MLEEDDRGEDAEPEHGVRTDIFQDLRVNKLRFVYLEAKEAGSTSEQSHESFDSFVVTCMQNHIQWRNSWGYFALQNYQESEKVETLF